MSVSRAGALGAALAVSGLAVLGLQSPASAVPGCPNPGGQYPPGRCDPANPGFQNRASDSTPGQGQSVHVHSEGWKSGSQGQTYVESQPVLLGSFTADSAGVVDTDVTVPASLPTGAHHLVLQGTAANGGNKTVAIPITVHAAASSRGSSSSSHAGVVSLPTTGREIAGVGATGLALLGAGTFAVYAGRRRRTGNV
jgi:hypothetical protein